MARGRLDSHREPVQKNPRRGFVAPRLGFAGRQSAFAERKIQSGLFRERPGDERALWAGVVPLRLFALAFQLRPTIPILPSAARPGRPTIFV